LSYSDTAQKNQLQLASKLSGANWLVWFTYTDRAGWQIGGSYGLSAKKKKQLAEFFAISTQANWLSGALASGRTRWQECISGLDMNCARLYLFPNPGDRSILAAGVDKLESEGENILKLLAYSPASLSASEQPNQFLVEPLESIWLKTFSDILAEIFIGQQIELIFQQITSAALSISSAKRVHLVVAPLDAENYDKKILASTYTAEGVPPSVRYQKLNPGEATRMSPPLTSFQKPKQVFSIPARPESPDQCIGSLEFFQPDLSDQTNLQAVYVLTGITALAVHNTLLTWKLAQAIENQQGDHSRLLQSLHLTALGQISSQIANSLNNPLTSIILSLELMNQRIEEYQRYLPAEISASLISHLNTSLEQSLRTRNIVWELLNSARETRPINKPDPESISQDLRGQ